MTRNCGSGGSLRRGRSDGPAPVAATASGSGAAATRASALLAEAHDALHGAGDLALARQRYRAACRAAQRADERGVLAESAAGLGGLWVHEHRSAADWTEMTLWLHRAARLVVPGSASDVLVRARLAAEDDYREGGHERVTAILQQARALDDPHTLATCLSLAHHCLLGPEHAAVRTRLAAELLLTAHRTGRHSDRLMGLLWRTVDAFLEGDPHAERRLQDLRGALADHDHLAVGFALRAMDVMLATRAGDLTGAEALAQECAGRGRAAGDADTPGWYHGQLVAVRWFQGRLGELLPVLSEQVHSAALGALDDSMVAALAVAAALEGDLLLARGALARLGRGDLRRVPSSSAWLVTLHGAVHAAAALRDTETLVRARELLRPYAGLPATASLAVTCFGSVRQGLGVAALALGDLDEAVDQLRAAVRANLALAHWPAHCLSRHQLARALALRGSAPDRHAAARELAVAEQQAHRLGMRLPVDAATPAPSSSGRRAGPAAGATASPDRVRAQVRLLGPIDVVRAGSVAAVRGHRRQTVLAVLALHAGDVVPVEQLIDQVWDRRAPRTAVNTLQRHVSLLRQMLGEPGAIVARSGGYLLDLQPEPTDVAVAEHLLRRAGAADPAAAARLLQRAAALWRGRPLHDLAEAAWAAEHAHRLERLLLDVRLALAEVWGRLGEHARAATDLEALARDHPLHERLHGQLMLALYRQGLQSRALEVYRALRSTLDDELGIAPSRPLRDLQVAILRQDPTIDHLAAPDAAGLAARGGRGGALVPGTAP